MKDIFINFHQQQFLPGFTAHIEFWITTITFISHKTLTGFEEGQK
jgi:hypothetical protein